MRLSIILFGTKLFSYGQEKILLFQTDQGNQMSCDAYCERTKTSGPDGNALWMPSGSGNQKALKERLKLNK